MIRLRRVTSVVIGFALIVCAALTAEDAEKPAEDAYKTEPIRGHIVYMADALERLHKVETVPEAHDRILALQTKDGQLYPIIEDVRGRAFRKDERLRNLEDCELLVRVHHGSPMVQVVRLYAHEKGKKYELDYWCEICAIAMFELKRCDCCQGETELRRREVE